MKELDDISDEHKQRDVFLNGFFYFSNIVAWNGMRLIAQYLIKAGKHVSLWIMKEEVKILVGVGLDGCSLNALHYCVTFFPESQFNSNLWILVSMKLAGNFS